MNPSVNTQSNVVEKPSFMSKLFKRKMGQGSTPAQKALATSARSNATAPLAARGGFEKIAQFRLGQPGSTNVRQQTSPTIQNTASQNQAVQNTNMGNRPTMPQTTPVGAPSASQEQPGVNPPIASATTQRFDPASVARSQYAASQLGSDEERRLREGLQQAGMYYGNKGAAPLGGFNIGGAGQSFQQAQQGLLNSLIASTNPQLQSLQANRQAALAAAQNVQGAVAPQFVSPGMVPVNPLTGEQGQFTGTQGGGSGLLVAGNIGQLPALQQAYTQMTNNLGSIQGIESLFAQELGGSQNASDINKVNALINRIKGNVSDPQYNRFRTLLTSLGSLYSGYLSGSGQETDTTRQIAQSLIDGTASADTINSVLNTLKSEGNVRLNQLQNTINQISQNPGSLPTAGSSAETSGGSGFATTW